MRDRQFSYLPDDTGSASAVVVLQSAKVLEFSALAAAIMTAEAKLI
jgi:hypothetical protein